jgi:hypothetical protein
MAIFSTALYLALPRSSSIEVMKDGAGNVR